MGVNSFSKCECGSHQVCKNRSNRVLPAGSEKEQEG